MAAPLGAQPASVAAAEEPALAAPAVSDPCTSVRPDEITVCGQRDQGERYRIDPGVLGAERAANANPEPNRNVSVKPEKCPPHGPRCSGQGAIPISAIALVAAKTAVLAATGEDWRKPLGLNDKAYDEYRAAKAKEERRRQERKVRVLGTVIGR